MVAVIPSGTELFALEQVDRHAPERGDVRGRITRSGPTLVFPHHPIGHRVAGASEWRAVSSSRLEKTRGESAAT